MTTTRSDEAHGSHLVPLISRLQYDAASAVIGCAAGLAVVLPTVGREHWTGTTALVQIAVSVGFAALWATGLVRAKTPAGTADAYDSAVPVADPAALWRDRAGRRRSLLTEAAYLALAAVGTVCLCGYLTHLPLLGLVFPLVQLVGMRRVGKAARWQRDHGLVLWQPEIGAAVHGTAAACWTTPREVVTAGR